MVKTMIKNRGRRLLKYISRSKMQALCSGCVPHQQTKTSCLGPYKCSTQPETQYIQSATPYVPSQLRALILTCSLFFILWKLLAFYRILQFPGPLKMETAYFKKCLNHLICFLQSFLKVLQTHLGKAIKNFRPKYFWCKDVLATHGQSAKQLTPNHNSKSWSWC